MNIINNRPPLFKKTGLSIWTDPYIQTNMLNAHLNLSSDAASRNKDSINTIVNFIDRHINKKSSLLDLGCGPGLYAERLTEKGHLVTGIDFNKKAIEYAINRETGINYIEGDYILNFPHASYDAIIMIYCDMGTHSDNDRDILLHNCFDSLENGGKLIFDVFDEKIIQDKIESKDWEYHPAGGFWSGEEYLLLSQTFHYPENKAFAYQYNLITGQENKHFIVWERYYTKEEITLILENIGFRKIEIVKGLLPANNFTSSNEMFIIAEK